MVLNLRNEMFTEKMFLLLKHGKMEIFSFRYESEVAALKIKNGSSEIVMLPFQGQQIWDFYYNGKKISMETTITRPKKTKEYLMNYGGFLYHCGITAFGCPQKDDDHPQHGELPNAEYRNAYIKIGQDDKGKFIVLGGEYEYDKAFTRKYTFIPECKIYENQGIFHYDIRLINRKNSPMEYMYLCHINFKPLQGARILYSAKKDSAHIKIHKEGMEKLPEKIREPLLKYVGELNKNISIADSVLEEGQIYNPEICFTVFYSGDENGKAYTMQREAGKGACFVSHYVEELPYVIRWISATPDEKAMGMALPATSEHLGYSYAKRNGQVKTLPPLGEARFRIDCGYIEEERAKEIEEQIDCILRADSLKS